MGDFKTPISNKMLQIFTLSQLTSCTQLAYKFGKRHCEKMYFQRVLQAETKAFFTFKMSGAR